MPEVHRPRPRFRRLFEEGFTAADVAEPLRFFDRSESVEAVAAVLAAHDRPVAGLLEEGEPVGYVEAADLAGAGSLEACRRPFASRPILAETTPLRRVIPAVHQASWCFVEVLDRPRATVGRTDLEKAPVRMWLFGMITLIESAATDAVIHYFPGDAWEEKLAAGRLAKARALREERSRRGREVALLDCLQLADKVAILLRDAAVRAQLQVTSRRETEANFKRLQSLRNNLAHGQPIVDDDWLTIVSLTESLEAVLALVPADSEPAGDVAGG